METLDRIFQDVPQDEREKLCWSNGIELYGIDNTRALIAKGLKGELAGDTAA